MGELSGPTNEIADAMFGDKGVGVTYICPNFYRLWVRAFGNWTTEVVGRGEATTFARGNGLTLGDMRVEPKEWNEL